MGQSGIPHEAESLIRAHIDSVDQLEALLLLRQTAPRLLTAAEVARELRIDEPLAAARLGQLVDQGFAEQLPEASAPRFRYAPRSGALDYGVARLSEAYADRRVAVITLIFSKPSDRIRSFADAFKLRKDK